MEAFEKLCRLPFFRQERVFLQLDAEPVEHGKHFLRSRMQQGHIGQRASLFRALGKAFSIQLSGGFKLRKQVGILLPGRGIFDGGESGLVLCEKSTYIQRIFT